MCNFSLLKALFLLLLLFATASAAVIPSPSAATAVTPYLATPITAGENIIFCSAFQTAWRMMSREIIGEHLQLEKPLNLVNHLNRALAAADDRSGSDYLALAGCGRDTIATRINRALRERFGDRAPHVDESYNRDDTIVAYACMIKQLRFAHRFERFSDPMPFHSARAFDSEGFTSFGIGGYDATRHSRLRTSVAVIDYAGPFDFIIRLATTDPDEEIIIARIDPGATLLETYESVRWRIASARRNHRITELRKGDVLQVPNLSLSADHSFASLEGLYLLNSGWEEYFVAAARQRIDFTLDERGADIAAEGILVITKGAPPRHRIMSCRRPFLIYCKKKSAEYPSLALWVGNSGPLVEQR